MTCYFWYNSIPSGSSTSSSYDQYQYEQYRLEDGKLISTGLTSGTVDGDLPEIHEPQLVVSESEDSDTADESEDTAESAIIENSDKAESESYESDGYFTEATETINEVAAMDLQDRDSLYKLLASYYFVDSLEYSLYFDDYDAVMDALESDDLDCVIDVEVNNAAGAAENWSLVIPPSEWMLEDPTFVTIFCNDMYTALNITIRLCESGYYSVDSEQYAFITGLLINEDSFYFETSSPTLYALYEPYVALWEERTGGTAELILN